MKAITICGTDAASCAVTIRASGHRRTRSFLVTSGPVCDPDEGAATLGFAVGDQVAGTSHDACGSCKKCVEGRYNLCENYGNTDVHLHHGHNYQVLSQSASLTASSPCSTFPMS